MTTTEKKKEKVNFRETAIDAGYKACRRADPDTPLCDGLLHQVTTGQISTDKYLDEVSKVANRPLRAKVKKKEKKEKELL